MPLHWHLQEVNARAGGSRRRRHWYKRVDLIRESQSKKFTIASQNTSQSNSNQLNSKATEPSSKMNGKFSTAMVILAALVVVASLAEAHKKFYSGPQFEGPQHDRCVCDCGHQQHQPVLPNRPYYGSGGYAQQPPRQQGGGYGNAGAYAVSGSYGSGGSQVSGGY